MVKVEAGGLYSTVNLDGPIRLSLMLIPQGRGAFADQARELLSALDHVLHQQPQPMTVTSQTVFLRDLADQAPCERLLAEYYGAAQPATNYVLQPPCCGAALSLEAWAIGGEGVAVERCGPHTLAVKYDGMRWVYCAGIQAEAARRSVYDAGLEVMQGLRTALAGAGMRFEQVVRTWFYLGGITEAEGKTQRYKELNRARTDFYRDLRFNASLTRPNVPHEMYPASTGIGMSGRDLVGGCLALQTTRPEAFLLPLENPQQTPAYAYHPRYSAQSPKFSRAMALVLGHYVTTWISGTASIVNSESRHPGDIEKQTEQTLENIERLIGPENFLFHGLQGAGADLQDLAKVRVYIKRAEDFAKCKAVCERRLGAVPAIYAVADICRPELLVEIEGVAFSRYARPQGSAASNGAKH